MKRMRILGLALVAVFAFVALSAVSASANTTGWYECAKLEKVEGKYTGTYTDKLCTTKATEAEALEGKKNKYNLQPGIGPKGKVTKGKAGASELVVVVPATGKGKLPGGGEVEVKCTSSKSAITPALPNKVHSVTSEFKGCTALGAPCSSGSKKGTITTNALAGELGDLKGGGVGTLLGAEGGPTSPLASFTCTEVASTVVFGSLISVQTGDVNAISKTSVANFQIGPGLGEVEYAPGAKYTPKVNIPTAFEGEAEGSHFLASEVTEAGSTESHTLPSGQVETSEQKGEAVMAKE